MRDRGSSTGRLTPPPKPFRVSAQYWDGWVEGWGRGARNKRRQPPIIHRDFDTFDEAKAYAVKLRARHPSVESLIWIETRVPPPTTPQRELAPWPLQARKLTR
jgi:hypothetical protein